MSDFDAIAYNMGKVQIKGRFRSITVISVRAQTEREKKQKRKVL